MKVSVYSSTACVHCKMVKKFFDDHNVQYTDIDIAQDRERAHEVFHKTGQLGVPVTIIEDDKEEKIIVGFDPAALAEALHIKTN